MSVRVYMHINSSKIDGSHKVHVLDVQVQVLTGILQS